MAKFIKHCPECGRTFDMLDKDAASEWLDGHDCEPERKSDNE